MEGKCIMGETMNKGIKETIKVKQEELNKMIEKGGVDKKEVLKLSMELDALIYKFYQLKKE